MARTFANAAVCDDRFAAVDAGCGVDFFQFIDGFECTVRSNCLAPWHIRCARDVTGTDCQFLYTCRCKNFAAVFISRADVDQSYIAFLFSRCDNIAQACAQGRIGCTDFDIAGGRCLGHRNQWAIFCFPFLATAIQQFDVLHAVDIKYPCAPCGKPVIGVAIQDDGAVIVDAGVTQQLFKVLLAGDVATDGIDQVGMPFKIYRARNMCAFEYAGIHADFNQAQFWIVDVFFQPVGADQEVARCCMRTPQQQAACDEQRFDDLHFDSPRYVKKALRSHITEEIADEQRSFFNNDIQKMHVA
ncbi:hypothetical protein D3C72_1092320 [compost metagenome]